MTKTYGLPKFNDVDDKMYQLLLQKLGGGKH